MQLATMACELMQSRRKELVAPSPQRRLHPTPRKPVGHGDDDDKRMRRPTAIMRSNVEVARLMGMPGSKQRHLSANDIEAEVEQPQHLCSTRPRHPEVKGKPNGLEDSTPNGRADGMNGGENGGGSGGAPRSGNPRSGQRRSRDGDVLNGHNGHANGCAETGGRKSRQMARLRATATTSPPPCRSCNRYPRSLPRRRRRSRAPCCTRCCRRPRRPSLLRPASLLVATSPACCCATRPRAISAVGGHRRGWRSTTRATRRQSTRRQRSRSRNRLRGESAAQPSRASPRLSRHRDPL